MQKLPTVWMEVSMLLTLAVVPRPVAGASSAVLPGLLGTVLDDQGRTFAKMPFFFGSGMLAASSSSVGRGNMILFSSNLNGDVVTSGVQSGS
jgi:hypothetical protein